MTLSFTRPAPRYALWQHTLGNGEKRLTKTDDVFGLGFSVNQHFGDTRRALHTYALEGAAGSLEPISVAMSAIIAWRGRSGGKATNNGCQLG